MDKMALYLFLGSGQLWGVFYQKWTVFNCRGGLGLSRLSIKAGGASYWVLSALEHSIGSAWWNLAPIAKLTDSIMRVFFKSPEEYVIGSKIVKPFTKKEVRAFAISSFPKICYCKKTLSHWRSVHNKWFWISQYLDCLIWQKAQSQTCSPGGVQTSLSLTCRNTP